MAKDITGTQAGTVKTDSVNNPGTRVIRGKNQFPQSFKHPSTGRYGEVDIVCACKAERGDTFPYKFVTDLNTFTMQSPIKSDVNMYSAAFKVPMQAIYPRNWDIMLPIPNKGDDVPDDTRAIFKPFALATKMLNLIGSAKNTRNADLYVRCVLMFEKIFSAGSLFSKLNIHLNSFKFRVVDSASEFSFDKYFDNYFVPWLRTLLTWNEAGPVSEAPKLMPIDPEDGMPHYIVVAPDSDLLNISTNTFYRFVTLRRAIEVLRNGEYMITFRNSNVDSTIVPGSGQLDFNSFAFSSSASIDTNFAINVESLVAYQLACAHFFTNSKIDFIYSAQLYRDNLQSLLFPDGNIPTFIWNGITKQYDVFSQNYFEIALRELTVENYIDIMSYYFNLFSFQRSLRYGDYFTGAHPEPLAVGDVNAPIVDGSVNALDITRKLQITRLLNRVNISGPRVADYLRALFGGPLPEAPKDVPVRLSLEKMNVSGFETNNTGSAQSDKEQNLITTNLRLTDSRYMFEAEIDEPCWLIAVQYFDVERIYSKTLDRFALHFDRFDDFIPDLQFTGDQEVKLRELDITQSDVPFAYNLRYMEYKNRYSYASGGFIENLPSWLFITDNSEGAPASNIITPDYIRSSPSEFDRFYRSLTGYSLGSYFHFIYVITNVVEPYRQMVYAPEILA